MSGRKFVVVAASVATLMSAAVVTAPMADAKPKAPAKVSKARVASVSTTAASLTWKNPKSKNFKATVVRIAAGTKAPKSVKAGRGIATVAKKRHAVTIGSLAAGTTYTVALFSSDGKKHYSKPVAVRVRTATPPPAPKPTPQPVPTTGNIAGVVYGGDQGTRLGNVQVTAYPYRDNATNLHAVTASNGSYSFVGLVPDNYDVCFDPDSALGGPAGQTYDSACLNDGNAVSVVAGANIPGDIVLAKPTTLSGKILGDGAPLGNVDAELYDSSGNQIDGYYTDDDGAYNFDRAGNAAQICFDTTEATGGSSTTGYASGCKPLALTAGSANTVDFALDHGGALTGTVKAPDGSAVNAFIELFDSSGNFINGQDDDVDNSGTYVIKGLKPLASYYVCFFARNEDGGLGNLSECYNDKPWSGDDTDLPATSTLTSVSVGKDATKTVSAVLAVGGAISGSVVDSDGNEVHGRLTAFDAAGHSNSSVHLLGDGDGTFDLAGLRTGNYTLCFESHEDDFVSQCYENIPWDGDSENIPSGTTSVHATTGQPGSDDVVLTIPHA